MYYIILGRPTLIPGFVSTDRLSLIALPHLILTELSWVKSNKLSRAPLTMYSV